MLDADFFARFTGHLREALQKALLFALKQHRSIVDPGDILVGILQEQGSIGAEMLTKAGITIEQAEQTFRGEPTEFVAGGAIAPDLSPMVKRLLETCIVIAHRHEHKYVGTEHLLFSLLDLPLPDIHAFLQKSGAHIEQIKEQINTLFKSTSRFPDLSGKPSEEDEHQPMEETTPHEHKRSPQDKRPRVLDAFTKDLTAPDIFPLLDPVIGRDQETERLIEILCRRTKNNPLLLGDPGVGKTAIVEGLAQRLVSGQVPDILQGRRIVALDMALLVAGTMYRGEFEARLKQLIEEAKQDKNVILFIDEIHTMVGAGSTSGSLDAANMLKPALARGEIRCIGATTWNEYKKHIEPDAALERRFQPIDVREPSPELTLRMLEGLKKRYEEHHGVKFESEALTAAVRLSERFLTDRFFPDKAIDLLDEAAAYVAAKRHSHESVERLRAVELALQIQQEAKQAAIEKADLATGARAQQDITRLEKEKKHLEKTIQREKHAHRIPITYAHVAHVVARMAHVSVDMILASERTQLAQLEERLKEVVLGQDTVIKAVSDVIRKARLGLSDPKRPKASFLFVGPSGVGKTELAKALAKEIFGREDALIKIDMSEFGESHSVSKLLGSPAGYVGYREQNRLADLLRKRPHSVLVFDEFEKAHPDVQYLLLQALEDGVMTDATGRPIPFKHSYIVLTSNVGAELLHRSHIGFHGTHETQFEQMVKDQLKERFRPELLHRLDRISVFQPLNEHTLKQIVSREIHQILQRVRAQQHVQYTVNHRVTDWLLKKATSHDEGARMARHIVEREIITLISEALIRHPAKRRFRFDVKKDQIVLQ